MVITASKNSVNVTEAAYMLNISVSKLYKIIHLGHLAAYKDSYGRAWQIPTKAVDEYVQKRMLDKK